MSLYSIQTQCPFCSEEPGHSGDVFLNVSAVRQSLDQSAGQSDDDTIAINELLEFNSLNSDQGPCPHVVFVYINVCSRRSRKNSCEHSRIEPIESSVATGWQHPLTVEFSKDSDVMIFLYELLTEGRIRIKERHEIAFETTYWAECTDDSASVQRFEAKLQVFFAVDVEAFLKELIAASEQFYARTRYTPLENGDYAEEGFKIEKDL